MDYELCEIPLGNILKKIRNKTQDKSILKSIRISVDVCEYNYIERVSVFILISPVWMCRIPCTYVCANVKELSLLYSVCGTWFVVSGVSTKSCSYKTSGGDGTS